MISRLKPCKGISPKTGRRVGTRHKWPKGRQGAGKWGEGRCLYCGRTADELVPTGRKLEQQTLNLLEGLTT
ncbi:hypothetical protein [Hyphomonas sp. UBA4494]|jgi:hypothetical protein|uniref:hypothetical protein n=1 Tax=Hyphomonas sp. UBA4494 TaxID=1946631 RepID=UPI0025BB7988|nr:hypothetical protein [Hyphomonas sp. UBA4494]